VGGERRRTRLGAIEWSSSPSRRTTGWFTDKTTANLSVGIRDAYYHGLAVAVPTGPRELGYAMDSKTYDRERQPST
jgi:hypothetical protein